MRCPENCALWCGSALGGQEPQPRHDGLNIGESSSPGGVGGVPRLGSALALSESSSLLLPPPSLCILINQTGSSRNLRSSPGGKRWPFPLSGHCTCVPLCLLPFAVPEEGTGLLFSLRSPSLLPKSHTPHLEIMGWGGCKTAGMTP